jgi:hypothetical protein
VLFDHKSQFFKGLFIPESAVREYTRYVIKELRDRTNTQYVEIRHNFMKANTLKTDNGDEVESASGSSSEPFLRIIREVLEEVHDEDKRTRNAKIFDLKVIYTTPRSLGDWVRTKRATEWALDDVIKMKRLFPELICGSLYPNAQACSNHPPEIPKKGSSLAYRCNMLTVLSAQDLILSVQKTGV